jgi:prolyl-tRNA synthetase
MEEIEKVLIGLTCTKESDFSDWYRQVITKAELIDYGDISGCYILRPGSYEIWEKIQKYIDSKIKKMGVKNAYFPLFGTKKNLEAEKSHIEGFQAEVAWVTETGATKLNEPIHVRATSETIMYPHFANWIKSHRDLPLKINQWCNVVRWEFKDCTPFIRSRELLWQEGHSCFLTKIEADTEVRRILDMYSDVYKKLLAVPVIQGRKSEREKFAGGDYTTTVECFIPTIGKAVQGATSHCLGQNFSKIFNIQVECVNNTKQFVCQNSWGITTRTIGVAIMVHGDNKGLVLPPKIAPIKVIVIPCGINSKSIPEEEKSVYQICNEISALLNENGISTEVDNRTNCRVGYKFNYWEMRGVPLRIEIGPKDLRNSRVCVCRRDTGKKSFIVNNALDKFVEEISDLLDHIQEDMFTKARIERDSCITVCNNITTFVLAISNKHMCLSPWCENIECEENIISQCKKSNFTVKSLCIPFDQMLATKITNDSTCSINDSTKCFNCEHSAKSYTLFGSSF